MLGDPAMMEEWKIGTRVAADGVSITDGGHGFGSGYMPFDDEGHHADDAPHQRWDALWATAQQHDCGRPRGDANG